MALAWVAERGKLDTAAGSGSTQAVTLSATCGAGNMVVLVFGARCTGITGCSVADSRSNTWTIDAGPFNASNDFVMVASTMQNTATLQSADTVTITFGTAPGNGRMAVLEEFSGITGRTVDKTAEANGTGVTSFPTGTTGATVTADEIAVAAWCCDTGFEGSLTGDAGYSAFTTLSIDPGAPADGFIKTLGMQYKILAATGAQSATASKVAPTVSYDGVIVTYMTGGQVLLPDADLAAGGWTTSPLFSKVNDASDATIITATAS